MGTLIFSFAQHYCTAKAGKAASILHLIWTKRGLFSGPHAVQDASCMVRGSPGSFHKGFQESPLLPSALLPGVGFEGGSWPGLRACQRLLKQFGVTDSNIPGLGGV